MKVAPKWPAIIALALGATVALRAKLDPSSPSVTLYDHPQVIAPAAPKAPPPAASLPELKQGPGGYWIVDFQHLACFTFNPPSTEAAPTPGSLAGIPPAVQALEGRRVRLSGFMLPLVMDERTGRVKEFLILRNQMACCFGLMPQPNEFVLATMKTEPTDERMDVPFNFYGTLHVGEVFEDKTFAGLYRLDCEKASAD